MAETKIADLAIVPEKFQAYVEKLIMERSNMFRSGLVVNAPTFIPSNGTLTNAPSFLGLDGDDEVLSDSGSLTVNAIGSTNAVSCINFRGKAFGANDLAGMLAGADPLGNLASKVADYWIRQYNRVTLHTLRGATEGADAAAAGSIILDASTAGITGDVIIDTKQLLGEYGDELDVMVCHSAVFSQLQKNDLIKDTVIESVGSPARTAKTYMGMEVIVDDIIAPVGGVYETYLASRGSLLYSQGIDSKLAIETDRDILSGSDIVTTRSRFILHPAGTTFTNASVAGISPTNGELATAANWGLEDTATRVPVRVLKSLLAV